MKEKLEKASKKQLLYSYLAVYYLIITALIMYQFIDEVVAQARGMFANCTHIIVSILKAAWNVTMVRIDCGDSTI